MANDKKKPEIFGRPQPDRGRDLANEVHELGEAVERLAKAVENQNTPAPRGRLNAGIAFVRLQKEIPMQTLPKHTSLNTNHAVLLIQPLDADGNAVDISSLGLPVSSDPAQSSASLHTESDGTVTGFDLSTPNDSGSVHYAFAPDGFDGVEFDFEYGPPKVGHLNPSFGDDAPDA